jgi:hypothetical protein
MQELDATGAVVNSSQAEKKWVLGPPRMLLGQSSAARGCIAVPSHDKMALLCAVCVLQDQHQGAERQE